jgi:hypothetical protein
LRSRDTLQHKDIHCIVATHEDGLVARDAGGIALIDDLARNVLYAFRTFRRAPLAPFTIVATVALGLGLVAAVFTFLNAFLRVDAAQKPSELFVVVWAAGPGAASSVPFTRAEYEALRRGPAFYPMSLPVRAAPRHASTVTR